MTLTSILSVFAGLIAIIVVAFKYGNKSAQLTETRKRLKKQAEEQYRAQKTLSEYLNMPSSELARRMRQKRETANNRLRPKD